jgi:hypothetical protein
MSCGSKKSIIEHPEHKIKYFFGQRINEIMDFLVLTTEEDAKNNGWFWNSSVRESLLKKKNKIPGILHVLNFEDINKPEIMKDFIIDGVPLPREMYIKLPNKNIYVSTDKYALKYLSLRENELKNIFIKLGAKTIRWTVKRSNNSNTNIEMGASISPNNMSGIKEEIKINNSNELSNSETNEMHFDFNENINKLDHNLFMNSDFYFLPKEYEWQDIIIRRIENNLMMDKYNFKYSDSIKFKSSLSSKLKLIDINFNYSTEEASNLEIEYEIEYYKTNNSLKNENKDDNKDDNKNEHNDEIIEK